MAVKTLRPNVKIVAVEAENVASFSAGLEAGKPTKIAIHPTLADGLAIPQVGSNAFQIAKPLVDLAVTVTEEPPSGIVVGTGAVMLVGPHAVGVATVVPNLMVLFP